MLQSVLIKKDNAVLQCIMSVFILSKISVIKSKLSILLASAFTCTQTYMSLYLYFFKWEMFFFFFVGHKIKRRKRVSPFLLEVSSISMLLIFLFFIYMAIINYIDRYLTFFLFTCKSYLLQLDNPTTNSNWGKGNATFSF